MGRLTYLINASLDGFAAGPGGSLEAFDVDDEVHAWFNKASEATDAFLYGRRIYEVMAYWLTAEDDPEIPPVMREFARVWNATPRIVFSSTLDSVDPGSRLERGTDLPAILAALRREFPGDLSVAGPTLAGAFLRAGLVDEVRLMVHPVVVGRGLPCFPDVDRPLPLRLRDTRSFSAGHVLLTYDVAESTSS